MKGATEILYPLRPCSPVIQRCVQDRIQVFWRSVLHVFYLERDSRKMTGNLFAHASSLFASCFAFSYINTYYYYYYMCWLNGFCSNT